MNNELHFFFIRFFSFFNLNFFFQSGFVSLAASFYYFNNLFFSYTSDQYGEKGLTGPLFTLQS